MTADALVNARLIPRGKADLAAFEDVHPCNTALPPELLVCLVGPQLGRVQDKGNNLGLLTRPGLGEDAAVRLDPLAMRKIGVDIPGFGTLGSRALSRQLLGFLMLGGLEFPKNLHTRIVTLERTASDGLLITRHLALSRHYRRNTAARFRRRTASHLLRPSRSFCAPFSASQFHVPPRDLDFRINHLWIGPIDHLAQPRGSRNDAQEGEQGSNQAGWTVEREASPLLLDDVQGNNLSGHLAFENVDLRTEGLDHPSQVCRRLVGDLPNRPGA